MDQRLGIVAYSDYICPWCYIGLRRIERLEREFPVDVEWRPFELHPETPRSGFDLSARLGGSPRARAYAENIVALAAESELTIRMPRAVANSHLALEAAEFAREHGGFRPPARRAVRGVLPGRARHRRGGGAGRGRRRLRHR